MNGKNCMVGDKFRRKKKKKKKKDAGLCWRMRLLLEIYLRCYLHFRPSLLYHGMVHYHSCTLLPYMPATCNPPAVRLLERKHASATYLWQLSCYHLATIHTYASQILLLSYAFSRLYHRGL